MDTKLLINKPGPLFLDNLRIVPTSTPNKNFPVTSYNTPQKLIKSTSVSTPITAEQLSANKAAKRRATLIPSHSSGVNVGSSTVCNHTASSGLKKNPFSHTNNAAITTPKVKSAAKKIPSSMNVNNGSVLQVVSHTAINKITASRIPKSKEKSAMKKQDSSESPINANVLLKQGSNGSKNKSSLRLDDVCLEQIDDSQLEYGDDLATPYTVTDFSRDFDRKGEIFRQVHIFFEVIYFL